MVAGDRKMKATGLLTNEWSNVRAIACHYDALGRSAFMTTLGKLGDRPCDCAGNLHNIRLLSKNNTTFQNGHLGALAFLLAALSRIALLFADFARDKSRRALRLVAFASGSSGVYESPRLREAHRQLTEQEGPNQPNEPPSTNRDSKSRISLNP